jgi:hypothetical protein
LRVRVLTVNFIAGLHVNPDLFGKPCLYPDTGVYEMSSLEIVSPVSGYKPVCNAPFSLPKGEQFVMLCSEIGFIPFYDL